MALRREGTVTGKLRGRHRGPDVIKFLAGRERSIERNADHDELKGLRHSLFTFKNDGHVWDPHRSYVHPCINITKSFRRKLAVLLLRSNVPAAVDGHDALGK